MIERKAPASETATKQRNANKHIHIHLDAVVARAASTQTTNTENTLCTRTYARRISIRVERRHARNNLGQRSHRSCFRA